MEVTTLKQQIQSKKIDHLLIFTGTEWAVQKIYIQQIAKVMGQDVRYCDSVEEVFKKLQNRSMLKTKNLYVVLDDTDYEKNEKLQARIKDVLIDDILILVYTKADKRKKIFKDAVEFELLKPQVLKKYIAKEITLSDRNMDKLIEVCEGDYGRILLEIDKIKHYQLGYGKDKEMLKPFDGCLLSLISDGTIYQPPKDAIFDFVDAVLLHKVELAWDLYEECKAVGEATMVMLSVLYNNARAVLQVQTCNTKEIGKSTGLTGWQIKNTQNKVGKYSTEKLIDMLKLIQKTESGIKTGRIEEEFAMDWVMVNVL